MQPCPLISGLEGTVLSSVGPSESSTTHCLQAWSKAEMGQGWGWGQVEGKAWMRDKGRGGGLERGSGHTGARTAAQMESETFAKPSPLPTSRSDGPVVPFRGDCTHSRDPHAGAIITSKAMNTFGPWGTAGPEDATTVVCHSIKQANSSNS